MERDIIHRIVGVTFKLSFGGRFERLDRILSRLRADDLSEEEITAWLRGSSSVRKFLPHWFPLRDACWVSLATRGFDPQDILRGLEREKDASDAGWHAHLALSRVIASGRIATEKITDA